MKKYLIILAVLWPAWVVANNIQISNVSLTGLSTGPKTVYVRFNISWENNWRTNVGPSNWDAAWVFIKYRRGGVGDWKHAYLNNTGHVIATSLTISTGLLTPGASFSNTTNPGIGAYIHRSAVGSGNISSAVTHLLWNFGANGISNADLIEIKVFAIEMVYVPQGTFAAGDPGEDDGTFVVTTINTANATTTPTGTGSLGGMAGGYPIGRFSANQHQPIVTNYPNGYNGFYCMKYEITQKGYVDFLNTLTYDQQKERVVTNIDSANTIARRFVMSASTSMINRNGIKAPSTHNRSSPLTFYCDYNDNNIPNEEGDGLGIACNYLYYDDVWAYLWWAGLRPMTNMEFEKGCRGDLPPVKNEYAWGSTERVATSVFTAIDAGKSTETTISITANTISAGPSRVGIFAKANSTRYSSGAAYYGMMEMTGNLTCYVVGISGNSTVEPKSYTGNHGNGILLENGNVPDNFSWPIQAGSVRLRPGTPTLPMTQQGVVSNATYIVLFGGRGVRSL